MGRIGMGEIVVVALIVLVLFGAKRIPEIGSAIGQAIREFKNAMKNNDADSKEKKDESKS